MNCYDSANFCHYKQLGEMHVTFIELGMACVDSGHGFLVVEWFSPEGRVPLKDMRTHVLWIHDWK